MANIDKYIHLFQKVEDGLLEKPGWYLLCMDQLQKISDAQWGCWNKMADGKMHLASTMIYNYKYWLKEISLSDLMIEAIKCYNEGCRVLAGISEPAPTEERFVSEFLTQKGYIIK